MYGPNTPEQNEYKRLLFDPEDNDDQDELKTKPDMALIHHETSDKYLFISTTDQKSATVVLVDKKGNSLERSNKWVILPLQVVHQGAGKSSNNKARKGTYESMTVPELQQRCKKYKIKTTGLRKAELIMALRSRR